MSAFRPWWDAVTPACQAALLALQKQPFIKQFYLAGGTALALQIGHRISRGLDWFSASIQPNRRERDSIRRALARCGDFAVTGEQDAMMFARLSAANSAADSLDNVKKYAQEGAKYIVRRQREKAKRGRL